MYYSSYVILQSKTIIYSNLFIYHYIQCVDIIRPWSFMIQIQVFKIIHKWIIDIVIYSHKTFCEAYLISGDSIFFCL